MIKYKVKKIQKLPDSWGKLKAFIERHKDTIVFATETQAVVAQFLDRPEIFYKPIHNFVSASDDTDTPKDVLRNIFSFCESVFGQDTYSYIRANAERYATSQQDIFSIIKRDINTFSERAADAVNSALQARVDMGAELEIEQKQFITSNLRTLLEQNLLDAGFAFIDQVVYDGSVRGNLEFRMGHTILPMWRYDKIVDFMAELKRLSMNNRTHTAGMHVHMSAPSKLATYVAAQRLVQNKEAAQKVLYPICGRHSTVRGTQPSIRYGMGNDITRGYTRHQTLELRVFEATTNPDVFYGRLKFCEYFFKFLLKDLPFEDFFKHMSKEDKDNYAFLVRTGNPHAFGMGKRAALKMLKEA